jgi:hypothetical protein
MHLSEVVGTIGTQGTVGTIGTGTFAKLAARFHQIGKGYLFARYMAPLIMDKLVL